MKVYALIANGSEEVECLAVVDILKRAGMEVILAAVGEGRTVTTAHNIVITADVNYEDCDASDGDLLFLPGGVPGTPNLEASEKVCRDVAEYYKAGKHVAAICAAPSILGHLGILEGKKATCFPGFEEDLRGAEYVSDGVVTDGTVTTARGLGFAIDLGLELVRVMISAEVSEDIKSKIQHP